MTSSYISVAHFTFIVTMTFNKKVCKAFFNFDSSLNKGHGIVSSIYGLIDRHKNVNEDYFKALEHRIHKEAILHNSNEALYDLLLLCWKNIPDGCSKWSTVAHMFFTTDVVDTIARGSLSTLEYEFFKSRAEKTLCYELDLKYGDALTEYAWDVFNISENARSLLKPIPLTDIICVSIFLYSVYNLL